MRIVIVVAGLLLACSAIGAELSLPDFICAEVSNAGERAQCLERAKVVTRHDTGTVSRDVSWYSVMWSMIWPVGWWVVYYGVGLLIGRYIYRDAKRRDWLLLGVRPVWWAVLAVFEPAIGLLVYWATHYSKLAQSYHEATEPSSNAAPLA
jgi:hypothetical protein